tara:strand:+ start:167 stop:307 length:141 start_codon:yes stop_codon:yes gene_type:complete
MSWSIGVVFVGEVVAKMIFSTFNHESFTNGVCWSPDESFKLAIVGV